MNKAVKRWCVNLYKYFIKVYISQFSEITNFNVAALELGSNTVFFEHKNLKAYHDEKFGGVLQSLDILSQPFRIFNKFQNVASVEIVSIYNFFFVVASDWLSSFSLHTKRCKAARTEETVKWYRYNIAKLTWYLFVGYCEFVLSSLPNLHQKKLFWSFWKSSNNWCDVDENGRDKV